MSSQTCIRRNSIGERCQNPYAPGSNYCMAPCVFPRTIEGDGFVTVHCTKPVIIDGEYSDPISPNHYKGIGGLEARDVIAAFKLGFNLGNVVKYVLRAKRKGNTEQDLRKARQYIDFELEDMKRDV